MNMRSFLALIAVAGVISSTTSINAATCSYGDDEIDTNSSYVAKSTCSTEDEDEN